jgi:hypothetical protein
VGDGHAQHHIQRQLDEHDRLIYQIRLKFESSRLVLRSLNEDVNGITA